MASLKTQLASFVNELHHLKALEQRYKDENADLLKKTEQESNANLELVAQLKEIEVKIRAKEDQIMYLRRELEGSKYSNAALIESNANMQVEIDSMNNHIRVVSHQNDQLTREIDQFVSANEKIREKLDRKNRV